MLGVPIGDADFSDKWVLDKVVNKASNVISHLSDLHDSQVAYLLPRFCLSYCKMVFYIRNIPFGSLESATATFDSMILSALADLLSFPIDPVNFRNQAIMRLTDGGLGLRSSNYHHPAAYYASLGSSVTAIRQLLSTSVFSDANLQEAKDACATILPDDFVFKGFDQSYYSQAFDDVFAKNYLATLPALDQARIRGASAPHASSFLSTPPIRAFGWSFSSLEFSVAVSFRMGLDFFDESFPCSSSSCSAEVDTRCQHALRCAGKDRIDRHNTLRDFFFRMCQHAQLNPVKEPANLLSDRLKPADFAIPNFADGKMLACDVAVTDTLQDRFLDRTSVEVGAAAEGYAADVKLRKYSSLCADAGILFTPLVVESCGAWNKAARAFISDLGRRLANRKFYGDGLNCTNFLYRSLNILLVKSNARMIISKMMLHPSSRENTLFID